MILKGNQRGGGQQLAAHLQNSFDNERVELAELRGSIAQDLAGAFDEWRSDASATKCKKYLYSLSLNPDQAQRRLTREEYLELLDRTERSLKLVGQPRAVVFHEKKDKDGVVREHCHAVWSRIDTEKTKAVQIAHDRLKLRTVAREFARDHGLELPDGLKKDGKKDRFNERAKQENLAERQQKERNGISKEQRMADIATCWRETGNAAAFVQALEAKGYFIAKGDQRAFVVVDLHGEVHSLSRQLSGVAKSKELKERLASLPLEALPDIAGAREQAKKKIEQAKDSEQQEAARAKEQQENERRREQQAERERQLQERREALKLRQDERRRELERYQFSLLSRHLNERESLKQMQDAENTGVVSARLARQPKGLLAFLSRITGIQAVIERRQEKQDQLRLQQQSVQQEALRRRHDRELAEVHRRREAMEALEARENRAAETALHREEFQKIAALVRKPPGREIKPEFERAAKPPVIERTGTDDNRAPVQQPQEQKQEKGRFSALFKKIVERIHPEPEKPAPEPPAAPLREQFEKKAEPPIDITEQFNRYVENRLEREERDRDFDDDGPDRSFDPNDKP
jgi:hypothetical protein